VGLGVERLGKGTQGNGVMEVHTKRTAEAPPLAPPHPTDPPTEYSKTLPHLPHDRHLLQKLVVLRRVVLQVLQDLDRHLLPAVAALVQVAERPRRHLGLDVQMGDVDLPVVGGWGAAGAAVRGAHVPIGRPQPVLRRCRRGLLLVVVLLLRRKGRRGGQGAPREVVPAAAVGRGGGGGGLLLRIRVRGTARAAAAAAGVRAAGDGGGRHAQQPLAQLLLEALPERVVPAVHHKDVEGKAVRRVEHVRFADVEAQVTLWGLVARLVGGWVGGWEGGWGEGAGCATAAV